MTNKETSTEHQDNTFWKGDLGSWIIFRCFQLLILQNAPHFVHSLAPMRNTKMGFSNYRDTIVGSDALHCLCHWTSRGVKTTTTTKITLGKAKSPYGVHQNNIGCLGNVMLVLWKIRVGDEHVESRHCVWHISLNICHSTLCTMY